MEELKPNCTETLSNYVLLDHSHKAAAQTSRSLWFWVNYSTWLSNQICLNLIFAIRAPQGAAQDHSVGSAVKQRCLPPYFFIFIIVFLWKGKRQRAVPPGPGPKKLIGKTFSRLWVPSNGGWQEMKSVWSELPQTDKSDRVTHNSTQKTEKKGEDKRWRECHGSRLRMDVFRL